MIKSKLTKSEKWILLGIPILIIIGFPMHFLYEWCGNLPIVGIFAPVNESIWEHLKLSFYPMIIWWFLGFLLYRNKDHISKEQWFTSAVISIIVCPIIITNFYYFYTGAFGIHNIILDVFSMILAITISQLLGLHTYKNAKFNKFTFYTSILLLIFLLFCFTLFTFNPPHIPLFKDNLTGTYGNKKRDI